MTIADGLVVDLGKRVGDFWINRGFGSDAYAYITNIIKEEYLKPKTWLAHTYIVQN